ncbi:MAG: hypothetical protein RL215_1471 [Planctomycetota bacterium]
MGDELGILGGLFFGSGDGDGESEEGELFEPVELWVLEDAVSDEEQGGWSEVGGGDEFREVLEGALDHSLRGE